MLNNSSNPEAGECFPSFFLCLFLGTEEQTQGLVGKHPTSEREALFRGGEDKISRWLIR